MIIRPATPHDAEDMAALLNRIIAIGGTTAHEIPMTGAEICHHFIDGPDCVTSVVAQQDAALIGWQSISWWQGEPHIGSFVNPVTQAKGIGAAMFALTLDLARSAGLTEIHASIRADNVPGLAYYARIGFTDCRHDPDFALRDGRVVGRIHRIYKI